MGLPGVKGDRGEKAEPGAKGEPGEKGEKGETGARGSGLPYGKLFPFCCNKKAEERNIIFLTLSHMTSEVLFTIWQVGQLAISAREDDISESKDDSGGRLHSCHALKYHVCTDLSNADLQ